MEAAMHLHGDCGSSHALAAATRIIQITDPHIFASPEERLDGVNTTDTLAQVLSLMRTQHWPPAAVVLTGDLVEKSSPTAYQNLRAQLVQLEVPVYCLPGNHDDPALMSRVLPGDNIYLVDHAFFGEWIVIFLSTHAPGNHGGHLDRSALESLGRLLRHPRAKYALVCLHHPVLPIGSPWLDAMKLDNPGDLFAVLDREPKARGVIWGHIHQEFSLYRNGVALLGAPSTCLQFLPKSDRFAPDALGPGYRWLTLGADGRLKSGLVRVPV
jgi:3',5'-cyclic-AMP phosphodiesterase